MALIIVRKNGPYRVHGPVTLQDHLGNEIPLPGEVFTLCRCGHSSTKPFCDGTHKRIGFSDVNPDPVNPEPPSPQP
jgi:3-phenylpropionate/trans-cinnamate dioxygenase ferredoxin subunit